MYVCTLGRYYDRVYFCFLHLEFEPSGSAVAPNPTSFKNGILGQKDHVSHWMDKMCVKMCVHEWSRSPLNIHKFKPRSNTARKYWSPTKLFVIRKIFWMYLYRNCLQRYSKCVAFLELNGIKKKVVQSLSDSCREFSVPKFAQSAKSSRRSSETRDWRKFSFMWWEYKKCSSGKKHRFFILFLLNW